MKKLLIIVMCVIMLAGCQNKTRKLDDEKYDAYLTYYQSILDNENKELSCQDFDCELVVNRISDKRYRYDVIIDNPRVAMYNMVIMAIVYDGTGEVNTKEMMPSIGIFEQEKYSMIPYQVDKEHYYVPGMDLSILSSESELTVDVMVAYEKKDGMQGKVHYLTMTAAYVEPEPEPEAPAEGQ